MRKKPYAAAAALAAAAPHPLRLRQRATATASRSPSSPPAGAARPATVLDQPFDKPDLVLTDTHGKKYDLRERRPRASPTLLYFGYTHCPDVCPLTMSNIAIAKKQLPKAEQDKLRVVFVTTDPERDTPTALGKWLGRRWTRPSSA